MRVKKVRIIWNMALMGTLFSGVLWWLKTDIPDNLDALYVGILGGIIYGFLHWRSLSYQVTRQHRRFGRNRIFVRFLSLFELLFAAATWNLILFTLLVLLIGTFFLLDSLSGHWWSILIASFGITAAAIVGGQIIRYERHHGPLYYQYDSRTWLGGEGLLYQKGKVVEPLTPQGRIKIQGELWNAISLSGQNIDAGREVEVVSRQGLILYVEDLPSN